MFPLKKVGQGVALLAVFLLALASAVYAQGPLSSGMEDSQAVSVSHRLIVELEAPPASVWARSSTSAKSSPNQLNLQTAAVQKYITQLKAEQRAFLMNLQQALPGATLSSYVNEQGRSVPETYQIVLNGMAIDPGKMDREEARKLLLALPGVKAVYLDYAHYPSLYTSTLLINAPTVWNDPAIGGRVQGGAGIKVASMDGGLHKDAPMFSGEGFTYPAGFPEGGLGYSSNNNGKIIASRVYFRSWDPPVPGDENPWPGEGGTPHGCHTAGIAAGNIVTATFGGVDFPMMSGVAPAAWLMSYRVFYNSVSGDMAFYTAEGIAALEDIVRDGADVLNNSWGAGPTSIGGQFDALDSALINAAKAGVFISLSAGNNGGRGTTDHPSPDYICVAASTSGGTLVLGKLSITAPTPVSATLEDIPFIPANFGPMPIPGQVITYPLALAEEVDPSNITGCSAWSGTPFSGKAVLIKRGDCYFSDKVRYAQEAGAEMVIIYNHSGDSLIHMACGDDCEDITIPSIFIGLSHGEALIQWYKDHGTASTICLDMHAHQIGNKPDVIASFSSRGPGVGNVLKPDITAPGVNILSQGYAPGAVGEDRYLEYGQASGTSMASPFVAGAAALLRQIHPDWPNAYIKSALMSTSKFMDIYNSDGSPAQPLDMGAGRLDLSRAVDPGIILTPPSVSFGQVYTGTTKTVTVTITSVAAQEESYTLSTLYTGNGFTATTSLPGVTLSARSITLAPGDSVTLSVTFDPATGQGFGDNQGFIVLDGSQHTAHMPVWARVMPTTQTADVLIIDNDASSTLGPPNFPDYLSYYTQTLEALGYTYEVWDADAHFGNPVTIPDLPVLTTYRAVLYFTGNNYFPSGYFAVPTPLTQRDGDILTEYANQGGLVIAMGQDMASVLNSLDEDAAWTLYQFVLGGKYVQDSVSNELTPTLPIQSLTSAPPAFQSMSINVGAEGDGAANQLFIDEISALPSKDPGFPENERPFTPLFAYQGPEIQEQGIVAMAHRDQPTLERPGVSYYGRSVYTTFGLEGVNNLSGYTSREELLRTLLNWGWDEPISTTITATCSTASNGLVTFEANMTSSLGSPGVSYRWDFGDNSPYAGPFATNSVSHIYTASGEYTVRVEIADTYGNRIIGSQVVTVTKSGGTALSLPLIFTSGH